MRKLTWQFVLMCLPLVFLFYVLSGWLLRPGPGQDEIPRIRLWHQSAQCGVNVDIEEYVKGVVAAEMPADFAFAALEAQAVASRTIAWQRYLQGPASGPGGSYHLISDYRSSQAWLSREECRRQWGLIGFYLKWWRISRAVEATRGLVLYYEGKPIFAAFHSTSGGRTENSENYWQTAEPYLRGVPSPWEKHSPVYCTETVLEISWLKGIMKRKGWDITLDPGQEPVEVLSRYPGGRVRKVRVFSRVISGRELREMLGLRSTWIEVSCDGDVIRFLVRGSGHGVGMSQYGADGLAREGYSFEEILGHYYRGAVIKKVY